MGASCCKASGTGGLSSTDTHKGTLHIMFDRIDKEKKGFISMKNLEDLMRDDKTYFKGKDTSHIMSKYGTDGKMTFEQFKGWWGSTYTTYGESDGNNLGDLVDEVNNEKKEQLATIAELTEGMSELRSKKNVNDVTGGSNSGHHLDGLAVSRS